MSITFSYKFFWLYQNETSNFAVGKLVLNWEMVIKIVNIKIKNRFKQVVIYSSQNLYSYFICSFSQLFSVLTKEIIY